MVSNESLNFVLSEYVKKKICKEKVAKFSGNHGNFEIN